MFGKVGDVADRDRRLKAVGGLRSAPGVCGNPFERVKRRFFYAVEKV